MIPRSPRSTLFPYTTLFRSASSSDVDSAVFEPGARRGDALPLVSAMGVQRARLGPNCHQLGHGTKAQIVRTTIDRKSTRLNSSHSQISYAVFCLKKKKQNEK